MNKIYIESLDPRIVEVSTLAVILISIFASLAFYAKANSSPQNDRFLAEIRRKVFHLIGLSVPASFYTNLKKNFISLDILKIGLFFWFIGSFLGEVLRLKSAVFGPIINSLFSMFLRPEEAHKASGMVPYAAACFIVIAFTPPVFAICGLIALVVGDMMGALIGVRFGSIKIFRKKSLQGTMACASSIAIFNYFFLRLATDISYSNSIILTSIGAIVGASLELFAELLVDDNLLIPCGTSFAMLISSKLLGFDVNLL